MMTIKDFARLCGCNAQTLRYYDRIQLLRPARVDEWSGYRYYEQKQAIDFVKIKNLQLAEFSIDEIKQLLQQTDQEVYDAFSRKIAEQQEKLSRILEIQKTYLKELCRLGHALRESPILLAGFGASRGMVMHQYYLHSQ
jgi:DNA-binding transcriptional MerR regulator